MTEMADKNLFCNIFGINELILCGFRKSVNGEAEPQHSPDGSGILFFLGQTSQVLKTCEVWPKKKRYNGQRAGNVNRQTQCLAPKYF